MSQISQGGQANLTGHMLEEQIINRIKGAGYTEVPSDKNLIKTKFFITEDKIYARHCYIGKGIYNTTLYTDILLYNRFKFPDKLSIEIKWQQTSGSVDEKYPYLVKNIKTRFPCPAIIIIDGGGYKSGSLDWLKNQVDDKLIGVYSLMDFLKWINSGGL